MTKTTLLTTIAALLLAVAGTCFAADDDAVVADVPAADDAVVADVPAADASTPAAAEDSFLDPDLTGPADDEDADVDPFESTFRYLKAKYGTETLTDDWFGYGEKLGDYGVEVSLAFTQMWQINARGGLATHRHSGRWAANYDLYAEFDLEKILSLKGGLMYVLVEGSWSNRLDRTSIGSAVGNINNNTTGGEEAIYVSELWYQQSFFNNMVNVRLGKVDLTSGFETQQFSLGFDQNAFAFDETSQFMNSALNTNPTIPFPNQGLGVMVLFRPTKLFFVAAGVADAQGDQRETGFNTAFHDEDYFFAIFETGLTPVIDSANGLMPGAYRVGFWYDPQDKPRLNGSGAKHDDMGFYLSFDQVVFKENVYLKDEQGLGVFARYGFADSDVNAIKCFWSAGAQYEGLVPTRDEDVFAFAFAQGKVDSDAGYNKELETIMEIYYNAQLTPWFNLTPSMQYIWDPGAVHGVGDAIVLGVRMQMFF